MDSLLRSLFFSPDGGLISGTSFIYTDKKDLMLFMFADKHKILYIDKTWSECPMVRIWKE